MPVGQLDELIDDSPSTRSGWSRLAAFSVAGSGSVEETPTGAREDGDRALELARAAKDPQVLWPAWAFERPLLSARRRRNAPALSWTNSCPRGVLRGSSEPQRELLGRPTPPSPFELIGRESALPRRKQHNRSRPHPGEGLQSPISRESLGRPRTSTARSVPGRTRPTRGCVLPSFSSSEAAGPRRTRA